MFPHRACLSAQKIEGARFHIHRAALPRGARLSAEAKARGPEQRKGRDIFKLGFVAVPADAGAGRVLCHEGMDNALGCNMECRGRKFTQFGKEGRNGIGRAEPPGGIVVLGPVGNNPSIAEVSMESEGLER